LMQSDRVMLAVQQRYIEKTFGTRCVVR